VAEAVAEAPVVLRIPVILEVGLRELFIQARLLLR
jgi:hypothetical protein